MGNKRYLKALLNFIQPKVKVQKKKNLNVSLLPLQVISITSAWNN
jgi:hypothetical protein